MRRASLAFKFRLSPSMLDVSSLEEYFATWARGRRAGGFTWSGISIMGIVNLLRDFRAGQEFDPSLLGFFINTFYFSRKALFAAISRCAPNLRGRLLDVGCGSMPYKRLFSSATSYTGMEIEGSSKRVDVYYGGAGFPFEDASFDSVVATQVLEHSFSPELFVGECARVLKDGGVLLLTVPFIWGEHEIPYDFGRYSSFGLKALLERNGFEIQTLERICVGPLALAQLASAFLHEALRGVFGWRIANLLCPWLSLPVNLFALIVRPFSGFVNGVYLDNVALAVKKPVK